MRDFVPLVTITIFILNIIVFIYSFQNPMELLESIFGTSDKLEEVIANFGFYPNLIREKPYILITHMFIHADWIHIFINMSLFLFVGMYLEERIGHFNFLLVFLFSGLFAIMFNILLRVLLDIPNVASIGASGALFGVLALGALLLPELKVPIILVPILNLISPFVYFLKFKIDGNLLLTFIFYIIFSLLVVFLDMSNLTEISHLGGMIGGFLYFWLIGNSKKKRKAKDIISDGFENYGFSLN